MQALNLTENALPEIPEKRYFTIGEVGELCDLKPHVLRYWEQEFSQLKPVKRRGNRRYYQREDVLLVCPTKSLLYEQGFTIEGARQQLAADGEEVASQASLMADILYELEEIKTILQPSPSSTT